MRYSYTWPAYTGEYPWDPDAVRAITAAEEWCTNNIPEKMWSIKKRQDKLSNIHVTFWFQRKEDLILFKMVCR